MLMTALQILATPAPPASPPHTPRVMFSSSVTRGSCNKNVFSKCDSVIREVPRGGLASLCREGATFVVPWGSHTAHISQGLAALVTSCG